MPLRLLPAAVGLRPLLLGAALALFPAAQALAVPITSGLVGYWAGDGDAQDGSGFGQHGTLLGDAGFAPGRVGQAFAFGGSGDAMQAGAAACRPAPPTAPSPSGSRATTTWWATASSPDGARERRPDERPHPGLVQQPRSPAHARSATIKSE